MNHPSLCLLLVDDHALFRTGMVMLLQQGWPHARVCQAANWHEAQQALASARPDLVLLDVHLPDSHGLSALLHLRQRWPDCPVLLMSAEVSADVVRQAREAGAMGFLPKSASPNEVLGAVRAAMVGERAFAAVPYEALSGLASAPSALSVRDAAVALTDVQRRILHYLGRGTPNKAIARHVGLSEMQVRAEVSWLTEALGASSREEAFRKAVDLGWVAA
jgi:two-component system, NarL family, nitrate/nitrite response regulator NarL